MIMRKDGSMTFSKDRWMQPAKIYSNIKLPLILLMGPKICSRRLVGINLLDECLKIVEVILRTEIVFLAHEETLKELQYVIDVSLVSIYCL